MQNILMAATGSFGALIAVHNTARRANLSLPMSAHEPRYRLEHSASGHARSNAMAAR